MVLFLLEREYIFFLFLAAMMMKNVLIFGQEEIA